jgi:hypothetical protein
MKTHAMTPLNYSTPTVIWKPVAFQSNDFEIGHRNFNLQDVFSLGSITRDDLQKLVDQHSGHQTSSWLHLLYVFGSKSSPPWGFLLFTRDRGATEVTHAMTRVYREHVADYQASNVATIATGMIEECGFKLNRNGQPPFVEVSWSFANSIIA